MAEPEKPPGPYPVEVSVSAAVEIQTGVAVDIAAPIEVEMDFDWDEAKRLGNLEERGGDFRDAALIFREPVIEKADMRENYG